MITFKKKCGKCRKNYVVATFRQRFVLCYDCQKQDLEGTISDPVFKELFAIPEDYYKKNAFLRNIKVNYLRYGTLTERQIEAFKKVVKDMETAEKEGEGSTEDTGAGTTSQEQE
ncbi:hypothetical protein COY95_05070, partial [Candidatus Woesearchaeota archaeon CG_4_10_14_0_8_um_filter_47_5]